MYEFFAPMFWVLILFFGVMAVNALQNLAQGKPAYQTDTIFNAPPGKAVDGNYDGNYAGSSCTHTNATMDAWWEVDLGKIYTIDHVTVFARTDCPPDTCGVRFRDVQLFVGYDGGEDYYVLKGFHAGILSGNYTFQLTSPSYGRWVRITRPSYVNGTEDWLNICEVDVRGHEMLEARFQLVDGKVGTGVVLKLSKESTKAVCCLQCKMEDNCSAVNYNYVTKVCKKFETLTAIEDSNDNNYLYRLP